MSAEHEVRVGQVWADNDPRSPGRKVLVIEVVRSISIPYAIVGSTSGRGRRTRIRLDRFRDVRSGYRLVHDAPGAMP